MTLTNAPLAGYPDLGDRVCEIIRQEILTNRLPPGSRLVVVELAQRLGVSRTPVSDALNILTAEGLVDSMPRKGYFVSKLDTKDIADLLDTRLIVELGAVERGIALVESPQIAEMRRLVDEMEDLIDAQDQYIDYGEFVARDNHLHLLMVGTAGNRRLTDIFRNLNAHTSVLRLHYALDKIHQPPRMNVQEHRVMVAALEDGDLELLKETITKHIRWPIARSEMLQKNEED